MKGRRSAKDRSEDKGLQGWDVKGRRSEDKGGKGGKGKKGKEGG